MMLLYICLVCLFFFFKQKTAYEMRISDWSSDVCSSDLRSASSDAANSRIVMPSNDQPCDKPTDFSSAADSESVTYSVGSLRLAPSIRNCMASVVLPEPGTPSVR